MDSITTVDIGRTAEGPLLLDVPTLIDTRQVITASSGGGKSWLLRRLIELMAKQVQVLVIDPEGEFNTLRERFDMLLVGAGGEIAPQERTARKLAAKLAELRVSAIIDLYDLGDWDARRAYLAAFLDGLMNIPKAEYHPIYVPIDEAHNFAPENASGAKDSPVARCRQAIRFLMSAGRKRAICGALATQRISKLDKDSIGDAKNVFIGNITLDVDQARAGDMLGLAKAERLALRELPPGGFYCYGPALGRGVKRFTTGPVITTHPRPGQRHLLEVPPASGAIQKIVAGLADLPQVVQQEADDLAAAQHQVRELQQQLRARPVQAPLVMPEPVIKHVEVTVFRDGEVGRLESAVAGLQAVAETFAAAGRQLVSTGEHFHAAAAEVTSAMHAAATPVHRAGPAPKADQIGPAALRRPAAPAAVRAAPRSTQPSTGPAADTAQNPVLGLPRGERAVLEALIQYPAGLRRDQLTVITGYKRSTRDAYIKRLDLKGYVAVSGDTITATDAGVATLPDAQPLPTGQALRELSLGRLPQGERAILSALIEAYPDAVGRDTLSEATGYKRSTRDAYIKRLASKELVDDLGGSQVRASATLFTD